MNSKGKTPAIKAHLRQVIDSLPSFGILSEIFTDP